MNTKYLLEERELRTMKLISFITGKLPMRYVHFVDLWFQVRQTFGDIEKFRELVWKNCHVASAFDESIVWLQYLDRLRNTDNKIKTPKEYWKLRRIHKYNFLVRIDNKLQKLLSANERRSKK